jgi:transposase
VRIAQGAPLGREPLVGRPAVRPDDPRKVGPQERLHHGPTPATVEQGHAYGASNVMRFVAQLRRDEAEGQPPRTSRRASATQVPTARHVAGLFLRCPADLKQDQQAYLDQLQGANPTVATAYRLTQSFAAMVRERGGERLDAWLAEAESSDVAPLRRFAQGLRKDLAAVRAGLTEPWSNGPTEGFVHKLKRVKRQAYGRAGFAVLRQRVVRAA